MFRTQSAWTTWLALASLLLLTQTSCDRRAAMDAPTDSEYAPVSAGTPLPPLEAEGWIGSAPQTTSADTANAPVRVVIGFAYWCGPCGAETPVLVDAYKRFRDQGVEFISLTGEGSDNLEHTQSFVSHHRIEWPVGYGAIKTLDALQVKVIPTIIVVGRDGVIRWHNFMPGSLDEQIMAALKS